MTKCLYVMGRYKNNLICISIEFNENILKNEKFTEKSWGHTYKSAHISVSICLRLLNLA